MRITKRNENKILSHIPRNLAHSSQINLIFLCLLDFYFTWSNSPQVPRVSHVFCRALRYSCTISFLANRIFQFFHHPKNYFYPEFYPNICYCWWKRKACIINNIHLPSFKSFNLFIHLPATHSFINTQNSHSSTNRIILHMLETKYVANFSHRISQDIHVIVYNYSQDNDNHLHNGTQRLILFISSISLTEEYCLLKGGNVHCAKNLLVFQRNLASSFYTASYITRKYSSYSPS